MRIKKWNFPVLKAARFKGGQADGPYEDWMLWVRVKDLPLDFPLDPNARHPDLHGRVPRAIERTLVEAPGEFWKRNSGLTMVARACEVKGNVATLALNLVNRSEEHEEGRRGDGVLNGGHSYAVLRKVLMAQEEDRKQAKDEPKPAKVDKAKDADEDKGVIANLEEAAASAEGDEETRQESFDARTAVVRIEVQVGLAEEDLPDISRARNLSAPVEEISLRNLGHVWEPIKRVLPAKERLRFAFMENDPEAPNAEHDVGDLVRLMVLFNSKLYPVEEKDPVAAFTSEKSLIHRWEIGDFEHLLKHLPQMMALHDTVTLTFPEYMGRNPGNYNGVEAARDEPFELMGGHKTKYRVPISFTFPVISALRVFLSEDGKGWAVDPKSLGNAGGVVHILVKDALRIYREMGKSSIAFFGRNRQVWETLRTKALLLRTRMVKAAA